MKRKISTLLLATMLTNVAAPLVAKAATQEGITAGLIRTAASAEDQVVSEESLKISLFEYYGNSKLAAYNEAFMVDQSNIKSITNNGGRYANSVITNAVDGDFSTHWETGNPNSSTFTNYVIVTFEEAELINRIVYAARQDGAKGKGFASKVKLYASESESGDDFKLIGTGSYNGSTGSVVEIQFEPTSCKRIKFVFAEASNSWASAAEFMFYREDAVKDAVGELFTDNTYSQVKDAFSDKALLESLAASAVNHPLGEELGKDISLALSIVTGEADFAGQIVTAEQHGDRVKHAQTNLKFSFGNNNQPTGLLARPGQTITVYVEAGGSDKLPTIVFSQQEGSYANWSRSVKLSEGKNVITVPEVPTDNWYAHEVTKGGPIYIDNPYTEEEQGMAPIIRIEGAESFPYLTADTDEEEFLAFLTEYKERIDADIAANPNVKDRTVIDTFEFVSEHIVFTGTASGAYQTYVTKGIKPLDTIASYNTYMDNIFQFYGLDRSSLVNDPGYIRENVRLAQPFGALYAAGNHVGIQRSHVASFLVPFEQGGGNWGLTHEIGHRMDVNARLYGESTNNMLAMYTSVIYGTTDKRIPYETHIYKNVVADEVPYYGGQGFFERIGVFWQLEMYKEGYWARLNQMYRERGTQLDSTNAELSKMQYLVEYSSEIVGLDLSEHFERHGFTVTDATKKAVSKYKKPTDKIWYLNTDSIEYEGEGLKKDAKIEILKTVNLEASSVTLNFAPENAYAGDVMGYEVLKDGKVVAFTSNNTYTDTTADFSADTVYTVIAYSYDLSTAAPVSVNIAEPSILADEKITLVLNEEFDLLDYVRAFDYAGESISDILVNHTIDITKNGMYTVTYSVTDRGVTKEKQITAEVVSGYDFLSDFEWESAKTAWGSVRKNSNLKLRVNGEARTFEKGFGIHAKGEIVYDVSNLPYDKFEAYVGVDQTILAQNNSSIEVIIYADENKVFESGLMKHATDAKFVSIDLAGISQLRFEVSDANNGNTSDHCVIGGVRLTTNDRKPELNVTSYKVKLGEKIDFMKGVSAFDSEDGDLTSKVEIVSNTYEAGETGRFEVTYRVTDKDGNQSVKTSQITVYEEFEVVKSEYGKFDTLAAYNAQFAVPVVAATNNGGNYGTSYLSYATDGDINTHWETGKPNSQSFCNEVIFTLEETSMIDKIGYAARRIGKGCAIEFEIYVSTEESGDDFILAGTGSWSGDAKDVYVINMSEVAAKRVKFKFLSAKDAWASISEITFYEKDAFADKMKNEVFTDETKTALMPSYDTLEELEALRMEAAAHVAGSLFAADLDLAESLIRAGFPELTIPSSISTKVGQVVDIQGTYAASDVKDGDLTSQVIVSGKVNFNKAGEYVITYTVTDSDGNKVVKTRTIAVVNMEDYVYLTDMDWTSTKNSYTAPRKDVSTSQNVIRLTGAAGEEMVFDRGIGAHSTSTIVYDLSNENYDYFTSYVGVDRQMYGTVGSVAFEVYVDGKLQYTSGVMTSKQAMEYVEVDINGAKELKLVVTDGGNGDGSDHANWADAKLHYAKEETVDLTKEVNIPDKNLESKLKAVLDKEEALTIGDMLALTDLDISASGITSLEGLQYAKNLESIDIALNEIRDLSPLNDLLKLTVISAAEQYYVAGMAELQNGVTVIGEQVIDMGGQILNPVSVMIRRQDATWNAEFTAEDGIVTILESEFKDGLNNIRVDYKAEVESYTLSVIYLLNK